MLKNEYLRAKIGVDTAENEPEKSQQLARFAELNRASHWLNSPGSCPNQPILRRGDYRIVFKN